MTMTCVLKTSLGSFLSFLLSLANMQSMTAGEQSRPSKKNFIKQIITSGALVFVTFIAVSNGVKVHIVLVVTDEEQAEPRIKGINWHDEQDADDVALLVGDCVGSKVCVDLQRKNKK